MGKRRTTRFTYADHLTHCEDERRRARTRAGRARRAPRAPRSRARRTPPPAPWLFARRSAASSPTSALRRPGRQTSSGTPRTAGRRSRAGDPATLLTTRWVCSRVHSPHAPRLIARLEHERPAGSQRAVDPRERPAPTSSPTIACATLPVIVARSTSTGGSVVASPVEPAHPALDARLPRATSSEAAAGSTPTTSTPRRGQEHLEASRPAADVEHAPRPELLGNRRVHLEITRGRRRRRRTAPASRGSVKAASGTATSAGATTRTSRRVRPTERAPRRPPTSSAATRSHPIIVLPRISISSAGVVARAPGRSAGSTRTMIPPFELAEMAMFPPIMNARPPKTLLLLRLAIAARTRIRFASSSSKAISCPRPVRRRGSRAARCARPRRTRAGRSCANAGTTPCRLASGCRR